MTKWIGFLIVIFSATVARADETERLSLGFNVGITPPVTFNGHEYSAFPTLGLDFVYRPIPWIGVGVSTQGNLYLPFTGSGVLVESKLLPQVLFFAGDSGFYAGLRGGFSTIYDAYTYSGNGTSLAAVWGTKIGYQYHFPGSRFAIGPEWTMDVSSSSSHTNSDSSVTVTIPSHTVHNLVLVFKWWF